MPVIPISIRDDNSYFSFVQQAVPGTPQAPIWFPRWVDGSIEYDLKTEEVYEGDGTRRASQLVKNQQMLKIKLKCYPRMNELGALEKMIMGTGADTITTSTPTSTSTGAVTGGSSTSITLTPGTGFAATGQSGTFIMLVGVGTTADPYEAVTFTAPVSGAVLTVAAGYNGGKFKSSHPSGTTVASIATINTSITSALTAGGTTVPVGNQLGISGTPVVVLSPGTSNEEFVTLNASSVTGTGPWTYTLANAATLKFAHSIGDVVSSPVIHVLTDQADGDFWTWEVGLGNLNGAAGTALRVRDCKVESCKESGKSGGIHCYELEVSGIASSVQSTAATITLEQHSLFLYTQGTWTLDGATTGDALNIQSYDITHKNNLSIEQTEQLVPATINFGKVNVDLKFEILYITPNRTYLIYFGSTSGTTDSQTIGAGAWNVAFLQPDGFQQVVYNLATTHYKKIGLPAPKNDGKAFKQAVEATSVSNAGANLFVRKVTVSNTQYSVY
jgi:hypothetical protein